MPFKKGDKKPPGSGRVKGKSVLALAVSARLEELGCDPIAGLARIALATETTDPSVSAHCYSRLANKVYADRKAIDLAGVDGGPIETHDSAVESLASRIDSIAESIRETATPRTAD